MKPNWFWLFVGIVVGAYVLPMVLGATKGKKASA